MILLIVKPSMLAGSVVLPTREVDKTESGVLGVIGLAYK